VAVRFSAPTYSVSEAGTNALITVNRVGAANIPISVSFATSDGTATAGLDYSTATGILFFAPGVINQSFTVPIIDDLLMEPTETVNLRLFNPAPANLTTLLSPSNAVLNILDNDSITIVPAGSVITAETIPNGSLDPNEPVTINFGLRNVGNVDTANLLARLLATNGVSGPSGPVSFGAVIAGGNTVSRAFSFTAVGTNGGTVTATFHLQDGTTDLGLVTFSFSLGRARFTFANTTGIVINDLAPANPYPSTILVSNVPGVVTNLTLSLFNLNHSYANDIDILLTAELAGLKTNSLIPMSDVGGFTTVSNANLTFDDNAGSLLTATAPIVSGTYLPSPVGPDAFDPPAPPPPYVTRLYDLCGGASPNGTWSLFVEDDSSGDKGAIPGGWSLTFETTSTGTPAADLSVNAVDSPDPTIINQLLHYTLFVTNNGPATATGVILTNVLPAGITSITAPANCTVVGNVVTCNLGTLPSGGGTNVVISIQPVVAGILTDTAVVTCNQTDLNLNNNSVSIKTTVITIPGLTVTRKDNDLVLSWPAAATNFNYRIEATDTLSPPNWVPVSNVQTPSGGLLTITISPTNRSRFYRLREP
jgi:uncharacterized repeat protein (TIGR01451 family)